MKLGETIRNNVKQNWYGGCHSLVCLMILLGVSLCLIACGSKNGNEAGGIKIIEGEVGKSYDITYDDFVEELGTPLTFAAGSDSKSDVKGIVDACKNLDKSMTSIDGYSQQVFVREIIFYINDTYGFSLSMFDMNVYSTVDEDKIVRVEICKKNMKDYSYSDRSNFMERFNGIANGVTKLLSGEQVSDYGSELKYKASDIAHYFRYNDSEVVFEQQDDMLGDLRYLSIMPVYEISPVETLDNEMSSDVQAEEVKPVWTLSQEELESNFMTCMYKAEVLSGEYTVLFSELLGCFFADYEINYFKADDEEKIREYGDVEGYLWENEIDPEYAYVAVVSGNVLNDIQYENFRYDASALVVLLSFNESGELLESVVVRENGSILGNIYEYYD